MNQYVVAVTDEESGLVQYVRVDKAHGKLGLLAAAERAFNSLTEILVHNERNM